MPIVSFEKFTKGKPVANPTSTPEQLQREIEGDTFMKHEPGFADRVKEVIQRRGADVEQKIAGEGDQADKTPLRRGFEAAADASGAVPEVAFQALPAWARHGLAAVGSKVGEGFKALTDAIGSNPDLQKWVQDHPETAKFVEETAGVGQAAGSIAGDILSEAGAAKAADAAVAKTKQVATDTSRFIVDKTKRSTADLIDRSKEVLNPSPTPEKALGEILQGKTKDLKPGAEALKSVDTKGVKTYAQLNEKLDDTISRLSRQVDDHLAADPSLTKLDDLATTITSKGGNTVSTNYVKTALDHLKEFYTTTADDASLADLEDIIKKADTEGLTKLEVNDISRLYNIEFGKKAFSKVGEPLTSVNAQMYENVRKGLKDVARSGMGGTAAEKTDKIISSLYNTRGLIEKNVEAVNKLQQKITERGLLEKVGYHASKYADILTGGTLRGIVGGLLPRGVGYKVLNALDLEKRLEANLKVIEDAIKSGKEEDIIKAVEQLDNDAR